MNIYIRKLFRTKDVYEQYKTDDIFVEAIKTTIADFMDRSLPYREICQASNFTVDQLSTADDLHRIPIIPTLYFKRNDISVTHHSLVEVTSSGTSGKASIISYSFPELLQMLKMAVNLGSVHHLFSLRPTHYIVLGYQPARKNKAIISKTAYLSTFYALPASRRFALTYKNDEYHLDIDKLIERIVYLSTRKTPVRLIGFPSYTYFLLQEMKQRGIKLTLPRHSRILFGGGWKQFAQQEISKHEMAELVKDVLGIERTEIAEFFGAAEHPTLYCTCRHGQFHVPAYARVFIRDVNTLKPLEHGQRGLVNLLTPIHSSIPIMSIMTDDLGVMRQGCVCGCGLETDTLEIIARVGVQDVKTCSAGAADYLKEEA